MKKIDRFSIRRQNMPRIWNMLTREWLERIV